jgi:hypothetical protein
VTAIFKRTSTAARGAVIRSMKPLNLDLFFQFESVSMGSVITLTIRLIKSFEYRTSKNLILKEIPVTTAVSELMKLIDDRISSDVALCKFRNNNFGI